MTAVRNPMSSPLPATQNTAPVIEYSCLYTHDLRRKAKRWQDGFLRYHTFNRRVMVYDTARNFIGDTFKRSEGDLEDGDDLELDKAFALVEVAQRICVTQTDLTELNESRHKSHQRQPTKTGLGVNRTVASSIIQTPVVNRTLAASAIRTHGSPAPAVGKHRSLGTLLGTPKGRLGKATLPVTSPFEERQEKERKRLHDESPKRPAKKPRLQEIHASDSGKSVHKASVGGTRQREVIDLCSDDNPAHVHAVPTKAAKSIVSNITTNENTAQSTASKPRQTPEVQPQDAEDEDEDVPRQARQPLRIISNAPRKMLLCQQPLARKRSDQAMTRSNSSSETDGSTKNAPPVKLDPQQQRLQERLARLGQKRHQGALPDSGQQGPPHRPEPRAHQAVESAKETQSIAPQRVRPVQQEQQPVMEERLQDRQEATPARAAPVLHQVPAPPPSRPLQTESIVHNLVQKAIPTRSITAPIPPPPPVNNNPRTLPNQDKPPTRAISNPQPKPAPRPAARIIVNKPVQANMPPPPPPKPVDPLDSGPWSREAMDLFDFWPPDRDASGHKLPLNAVTKLNVSR